MDVGHGHLPKLVAGRFYHFSLAAHTLAHAETWAARLRVPGYAMDDETAIKVVDGAVEVVSEGHWKLFTP
jgi:dipeptidase E